MLVGLVGGTAIAWLTRTEISSDVQQEPARKVAGIGERRPDFVHAGTGGELWRASDFDGRPTLINFWATWCAPCLREMPLLQDFASQFSGRLNVVGIAIDDPGEVGEFAARLGVTYPILIGTSDVRETQALFGNPGGMLPYSVLFDASGVIRWNHLGELDEEMLRDSLRPYVRNPGRQP